MILGSLIVWGKSPPQGQQDLFPASGLQVFFVGGKKNASVSFIMNFIPINSHLLAYYDHGLSNNKPLSLWIAGSGTNPARADFGVHFVMPWNLQWFGGVGVRAGSREGPPCAPGELQGEGAVIPQPLLLCTPSHFSAAQCSSGMITKPYGHTNAHISACWQNESLLILSPSPPSAWERGEWGGWFYCAEEMTDLITLVWSISRA